jgi:hypothetical protein
MQSRLAAEDIDGLVGVGERPIEIRPLVELTAGDAVRAAGLPMGQKVQLPRISETLGLPCLE